MNLDDLWTIVDGDGVPIIPLDQNDGNDDQGLLLYRSVEAAECAAENAEEYRQDRGYHAETLAKVLGVRRVPDPEFLFVVKQIADFLDAAEGSDKGGQIAIARDLCNEFWINWEAAKGEPKASEPKRDETIREIQDAIDKFKESHQESLLEVTINSDHVVVLHGKDEYSEIAEEAIYRRDASILDEIRELEKEYE